jgi:hypothetical protein
MSDPLSLDEKTIDLCIDAVYDEGRTVDDFLVLYPESKVAEPLLRLSERLQSARSRIAAPTEFRSSAWERLESRMEQAAPTHATALGRSNGRSVEQPRSRKKIPWHIFHAPATRTASQPKARPRQAFRSNPQRLLHVYAFAFAVILLVLLATATTAYASRSLPGELFYQVKIASEQARLALATSSTADTRLHIQFAGQRFQEIKGLIQHGMTAQLPPTVRSYQEEINQVVTAYFTSPDIPQQDKDGLLRQLTELLASNDQQITILLADLPTDHPEVTRETITFIVNEMKPAAEMTYQLFADLREEIYLDKDLLEELHSFPNLETVIAPEITTLTRESPTCTPMSVFLRTPTPGATSTKEEEPELPKLVTTPRPTPWITNWATLIPDFTFTPSAEWIETLIPTEIIGIAPTYLPTYLPTYFPTSEPEDGNYGEGDDGGDDEFPGWDWPTDFPDNDEETPPDWWQP